LIAREMFEEVKLKFLLIGHILGKSLLFFFKQHAKKYKVQLVENNNNNILFKCKYNANNLF
jgi:hypothetical protein